MCGKMCFPKMATTVSCPSSRTFPFPYQEVKSMSIPLKFEWTFRTAWTKTVRQKWHCVTLEASLDQPVSLRALTFRTWPPGCEWRQSAYGEEPRPLALAEFSVKNKPDLASHMNDSFKTRYHSPQLSYSSQCHIPQRWAIFTKPIPSSKFMS